MIEKLCGAEIKIVPGGLQHRSFIPEEFFFLYLRNKTTCEDSGTGRWFLMERAERSGAEVNVSWFFSASISHYIMAEKNRSRN